MFRNWAKWRKLDPLGPVGLGVVPQGVSTGLWPVRGALRAYLSFTGTPPCSLLF
jgi:hypothetical protein